MRPVRTLSGAVMALSLAVATIVMASPANAASVNYVALGDSYSSGVGAGSYTSSSGSCERSTNAYSQLWANAHAPSSYTSVACSGAVTSDVLNSQVSALSSATTLVSITIGGNDAGFASTMETCVLEGTSACLSAVNSAEAYAKSTLPGLLDQVYSAIHADAPNAHVVVMGYPELYQIGGNCWFGIGDTSRSAINGAADALDSVIAQHAAKAGFTFGDVRSSFSGHEICNSDPWLNSTTFPIDESYHPTQSGQEYGYLPVFTADAS
ncbi:lysophospholipase L1-like esterase [Kitasatospora sp. MAP12-15]|uniref:SGNH/GDSL hydrolase family protein n=1 Tax=unclassified Kitasatospora TaxID=2633591 RepID=UPI002475CF4D|nr:SGNH/GDSL hydrolase family protein [Kitasatospora sp. MAP12-44]MDH6114057.1 lysophospholipase L1-like esterase [Kitasatospora sp. MAP12-44]